MEVSGDLLSAAGLLLATVSLLFSTWHPEITAAMEVPTKGRHADRGPGVSQVRQALLYRAIPLLIAILLIFLTCAPPSISVVVRAVTDDWGNPYDPVGAMFVGVWVLTLGLAMVIASQVRKLNTKRRKLNEPDAASP